MKSSDVGRWWPVGVAAVVAAMAVWVSWRLVPSEEREGAGALALPHAELGCDDCHGAGEPAAACGGCHGPHPSRRAGHRRQVAAGAMTCTTCHAPHGADAGIRVGGEGLVYYEVGREVVLASGARGMSATVPLVFRGACERCHGGEGDPIGRCGEGAHPGCFDEHRDPLAPGPDEGVCAAQHGPGRYAAWELAASVEVPAAEKAPRGGPPSVWLGAGLGTAVLTLAIGAGARRRRRRRRRAPAPAPRAAERRRLPVIDASRCLGCYACVDACPYDVLAVERYVATVVRSEACCGLVLCEKVCPNGSLTMQEGEPVADHPRLDETLGVEGTPGLFLAGDITGVPLIKSAILQGREAVDGVAARGQRRGGLDLVVVGAGPAGISAALRAAELGLSCRVLEQGSVAQSIRSFPRGKLVFDQPLELPRVGKLWLEQCTKEELLAKWLRVVRQEELEIDEGRRVVAVDPAEAGFVITASDEEGRPHRYETAQVVLAIGSRGNPRRLDVPLDDTTEAKVFYALADARSWAGRRVLVVGLGDVAMETAIALSRQPGTEVTVSYRGEAMKRGKAKNREELQRLVDQDQIELNFRSEVEAITATEVVLRTPEGMAPRPNDVVFVMIGSEPPRPWLERLGVRFGV